MDIISHFKHKFTWMLLLLSLGYAVSAAAAPDSVKFKHSQADGKTLHNNEYELAIYRLPPGTNLSGQLCRVGRPCQKIEKQGYRFYALTSNFDQIDDDFLVTKVNQLQQYAVSGNYQLSLGKYFTVSFKKSGEINGQHLFEEISFIVKPVSQQAGNLQIYAIGLFKYHMLGSGNKSSSLDRQVAFRSTISESQNLLVIAETTASKNEPVYLAVIKQCNEIIIPSFEVKLLEKNL